MPVDFAPSFPEKEQVALELPDSNLHITNFTDYRFDSNFLIPSDGWTFTIGAERLSDDEKEALKPGTLVRLTVNGGVEGTGYIDSVEVNASRAGGSQWHISGRDKLAQVVDAGADPTMIFKDGTTLEDALVKLFTPFGWSTPDQFIVSNDADRDLKTNHYRSKTKRSEAKGFSRRALKEYKAHQNKPLPRESVYQFATRLSQRFGLWIWSTASGNQIVVSEPDFDTDPYYKLFRSYDGTTNVLEGSVKFDGKDQPTHIVADGYAQSGEFGKSKIRAIYANVAMDLGSESTPAVLQPYINAGARVISSPTIPASSVMKAPRPRILYLHDDESQDQDQLEAFLRREMALLQRESLAVNFTVEGHGQIVQETFVPWTVDTIVTVADDLSGLYEDLYVLGRTFTKSRGAGTKTELQLIRKNTLVFSDAGSSPK